MTRKTLAYQCTSEGRSKNENAMKKMVVIFCMMLVVGCFGINAGAVIGCPEDKHNKATMRWDTIDHWSTTHQWKSQTCVVAHAIARRTWRCLNCGVIGYEDEYHETHTVCDKKNNN